MSFPPKSAPVAVGELCACLAQPEYKSSIDACEIFGEGPVLADCASEGG